MPAQKHPRSKPLATRNLMSSPAPSLIWMGLFLVGVCALALLVSERLLAIFEANPFFNGVILAVLAAGITINTRQVLILTGEVHWISSFRSSSSDQAPVGETRLLTPMARMLAGRERGRSALSAASMRTILDSVQLRLEESRDLSRYLASLAIFLGLLGTFWGLLLTISAVSDIIGALSIGENAINIFAALKENLQHPLKGMATSFSTSLFGLASSLVVGFLDLQAGHAQNRFYNELEEWLSGMTHLAPASAPASDSFVSPFVQALLAQTAENLERMQRTLSQLERSHRDADERVDIFATQFERLNELLERDIVERQTSSAVQDELKNVLRQIASQFKRESQLPDDLRKELRLLARTVAVALDGSRA